MLIYAGGRIDHAHHDSNAKRAMDETVEFMSAVQRAVDMTDDKDTLIVVTADHSHVYTMGGYSLLGNPILGKIVKRLRYIIFLTNNKPIDMSYSGCPGD